MYKPHTIEQYKIQQFLDHTFAMEHFLVSPLSRSALMLEDRCGERIAFSFSDNEVREIPIPSAPSPDKVKSFIRSFRALGAKPHLRTFEDVTRWWLNHPNPLTYQQALGLPDELYAPAPCGVGCRQVWTSEEKRRKVHLLSGAELHFFRSVQAHLQASNAAHRTPCQRTCLFPFGLRWIPLVDNLAQ